MVSPRSNEWHTDYWLAHFLDGKQTLIISLSDFEGNDFPIGLMVIKGEYLTEVAHARKKKGYVFEDYRPGQIVYNYRNLINWHKPPAANNAKQELIKVTILVALF